MTKYCAIEGSSYAGKTTVVRGLSGKGFTTIAEYDEFIDLNGDASHDKVAMADALIDVERLRWDIANRAAEEVVFSDRSVLSLLTYYDMLILRGIGDRDENLRVRDHILNRVERELSIGNIALMNTLIVMGVNRREFRKRVKTRGVTPVTHLADFQVARHISSRALEYGVQLLGSSSVANVDVSGLSEEESVEAVIDTAHKLPKAGTLQRRFNELK